MLLGSQDRYQTTRRLRSRALFGLFRLAISLFVVFLGLGLAAFLTRGDGTAGPGFDLGSSFPQEARLAPDPFHQRRHAVSPLPITSYREARTKGHIGDLQRDCLLAGHWVEDTRSRKDLTELHAILSLSPAARDLLELAARQRVLICFDWQTKLMAYYRAGLRLIAINPYLKKGKMIAYLAHELAHVPQHGAYSDNRFFPPQDLILLRRMREAAAEALATRIAWQLRREGYPDAWVLKDQDEFYGDITAAFAASYGALPSPGQSKDREIRATRAAFDAWFALPRRLAVYDRMTLDHLITIARDDLGLVTPRMALSDAFLVGIGRVGDGNYLLAENRRPLTDAYYTSGLSAENQALLRDILSNAGLVRQSPRSH